MKKMRWLLSLALVVACQAGFARVSSAQNVQAVTPPAPMVDYSRLAASLEQSGAGYKKTQSNVWEVYVPAKDKSTRTIYVTANKEIVSFIIILSELTKKPAPDIDSRLLELTSKYYFVKFLYDTKNYYMRIDAFLPSLDGNVVAGLISYLNTAFDAESENLRKMVGAPASKAPVPPAPK